ncbi:hypothetical protein Avbf_15659 [Armadillidium vulgare]|nr:hypothetical protein Avbf_15659 [Armadillidium vulgare]
MKGNLLQVNPQKCLQDEPVCIIIENLPPGSDIRLTVLKGHLNEMDAYKADDDLILDSAIHERIFLTENTKRIPVREGRIRGTLFIPEGEGSFPGVLDLFGGIGGLIEFRAAQFAARGFVSLALAYFDHEDLPKDISDGRLYKWFICELTETTQDEDQDYSSSTICLTKVKFEEADLVSTFDVAADPSTCPECQIPIEEADTHFLLLCSKDDKSGNIEKEHDRILSILESRGKDNCELIKYEGAGHLLEPPYAPFARATFHPIFKINRLWGGNAFQHTQASEDSWRRIQEFIRKYIN